MRIYLPEKIGFCFGVKRAVARVEEELKKGRGDVYSLGELIHNPQVMEGLIKGGLKIISGLSGIQEGTVFTRAHGTNHSLIGEAKKRGIRIIETTCPYVLRVQKIARSLAEKSYHIVIVGSKDHPEIKSLISNTSTKNLYVVGTPEEVAQIPPVKKIGVLVQTTESLDNFKNIVNNLLEGRLEVRIFNTVCRVVRERQEETKKLAKKVEGMIIVGGYKSSNTQKLVKLCQEAGAKTYFVERKEDIDYRKIMKLNSVGITGGTSTPGKIIKEIERLILNSIREGGRSG
jgi:4-hydroxy-3-methylbut-2-enyl diphosphate reductase